VFDTWKKLHGSDHRQGTACWHNDDGSLPFTQLNSVMSRVVSDVPANQQDSSSLICYRHF